MLEQLDNALKKFKMKDEKPSRRDSVFSKITNYRQKWVSRLKIVIHFRCRLEWHNDPVKG